MKDTSAEQFQSITANAKELGDELKGASNFTLKTILNSLIEMVTLQTDQLTIVFQPQGLAFRLGADLLDEDVITLSKPMTIRRRGQEMKMIIGGEEPKVSKPDQALIKLVAKAHLLKTELESGAITSIKDFASKYKIDHGDAKNLAPISYLAPNIVADIVAGHQPLDLTARRLKYMSNLPIVWAKQRRFLSFN